MTVPRLFCDADVLFAGAAGPTEFGASHVLLRMGQYTLLDCVTSAQAVGEARRNLIAKLPQSVATFDALVSRCLRVVPHPDRTDVLRHRGLADEKDLPILTAAIAAECRWLLTFNLRHYWPPADLILVRRPGGFLAAVRSKLASLGETDA
jgi:hypothetical protein